MKKTALLLLLIAAMTSIRFLAPTPDVRAQEEQSGADADLLARVEHLEDLVLFHSHQREWGEIRSRLDSIEASLSQRQANASDIGSPRPLPATSSSESAASLVRDVRELKRDVARLATKVSSMDRSIDPLKQDIAKLRLSVTRLESTVTRIDLSR